MVAAGMFNPIVFKRLNKSWLADDLMPILTTTYKEIEAFLSLKLYHEIDTIKVFSSVEEQNDWMGRAQLHGYGQYLTEEIIEEVEGIDFPYGGGLLKQTGWINLKDLLLGYRNYLKDEDLLLEDYVDHNQIQFLDHGIDYHDYEVKGIIFCEGSQVKNNPFFNHLPYTITKGELISIEIPDVEIKKILNKGFFILPVSNGIFKVGATYNWKETHGAPTEEAKMELLTKFEKLCGHHYHLVNHEAGLRPTTKDRKPILGEHPKHKGIYVFNGLGTKGVMLAPYFVQHFSDFLILRTPLMKDVSVDRIKCE